MDEAAKTEMVEALDRVTDPDDLEAMLGMLMTQPNPVRVMTLRSLRQALSEAGEDDTHDHLDAKARAVLYHKLEALVAEYREHTIAWMVAFNECDCSDCRAASAAWN